MTRRTFSKLGAMTAWGLATTAVRAVSGANDRVRLGFIGVGNRGKQVLGAFCGQPDVDPVAVCDVDSDYLERARQAAGGKAATYSDFRKLLDRKDIDAVVIATPDHWHALQTIMACQAGKDVYVEKPLSFTVVEGRRIVQAVQKHSRICQVGTQRRSTEAYRKLAEAVQSGKIGKVTVARAYRLSNMWPKGIGKADNADPPSTLNWDLWLGPRPKRPFKPNIAPYKFRWWLQYSSQLANWGVHYFDAMRWVTGDKAPCSISAHGGKFAVDDDRTVPDTLEAICEMPSGRLFTFGQYEASGNPAMRSGEIEFRGTLGTVYSSAQGYEVVPEHGGQFQEPKPRMEPAKIRTNDGDSTANHVRNFLDCVKSRTRCNADVEEGHRSTTFSLLVNIALATRSRIDWDADKERITNNEEANKLLHYEYREPWRLPA